jgi:hypothetical protein
MKKLYLSTISKKLIISSIIITVLLIISLFLNIIQFYNPNQKDSESIVENIQMESLSFHNARSEENPGFIVLQNKGSTSLDSKKFKLYVNKKVQDKDGCEMEGKIDPTYSCKLNFFNECLPGDTIEVEYNKLSVFIEPC